MIHNDHKNAVGHSVEPACRSFCMVHPYSVGGGVVYEYKDDNTTLMIHNDHKNAVGHSVEPAGRSFCMVHYPDTTCLSTFRALSTATDGPQRVGSVTT